MFEPGARATALIESMKPFLAEDVYPAEASLPHGAELDSERVQPVVMEKLKARARGLGLWNLFLPHAEDGHEPMSNVDYAFLAELSGRSPAVAPEAMNCSAPATAATPWCSCLVTRRAWRSCAT